jgi:Zn-dependent protease
LERELFSSFALMQLIIITPVFGEVGGYIFQMIYLFTVTNIVLAIFNLIPIPPLDGYHVLNDLILKRPLFASAQIQRYSMIVLVALVFTGISGAIISFFMDGALNIVGGIAAWVFRAVGLI